MFNYKYTSLLYLNHRLNPIHSLSTAPFSSHQKLYMGKLDLEAELKSSPDKLWGIITDSTNVLPKVYPNRFKSVEVLEGDGKSVGSVVVFKYADGYPLITFSKERTEEVDETNKAFTYSVIDGEISHMYKKFKITVQLVPKGDGSLIKWSLDYEKVNEEVPEPDFLKELAVKSFEGMDAYVQKA